MDGIQAAVLGVKLRYLEEGNQSRRLHAADYDKALGVIEEVITPVCASYAQHVYHVYAIRVQERDAFLLSMAGHGIGCGIHYPVPIHQQPAYRNLGYQHGAFPVSERCAKEFVSLPMFPELTADQLEMVVQAVKESVSTGVLA